jgi:succinate dehydrogenase/fumarate reductase flavoprotein subunit
VAGEVGGGVHGENRLMGNSLLDILVFGRLAGASAGVFAKGATAGKLTLDHVRAYTKELEDAKVGLDRISPLLLPDYTLADTKSRQLTSHYVGSLR